MSNELVYVKAKTGKRLFAHFFDIGILFLSVAITFSITNIAVTNSGFYKAKQLELTQIKNDSKLYVNDVDIVTKATNDGELDTYDKKKTYLSERIDQFYSNPTYFSDTTIATDYNNRKLANTDLFYDDGGVAKEKAVDGKLLFDFYAAEVNDRCLGHLFRNPTYIFLTRYGFLTVLVQIAVLLVFYFTIYYLLLPLTVFKRGRQTIGMKLEKIGLISVYADNITTGKYVGRFFFMFLVFIVLNFVSFLIPSFVSLGMMYFTKTNSSLVNYVFNDYMVDITNSKIYLNALEIEESQIKLQDISIENKDLRLK